MTFLLYCHSSKCADEKEKREYYCHSMSVYGYILLSDIYSVTTDIIYPVWVTTLLLPVVSCCQNHLGHFPWTRHGRKPEICCWNSDAIYRSSRDISTSGLGSYIAISGCQLSSKSSGGTFFLPVMVENPGLPLEFRCYLYYFHRYKYFGFRWPYCYGCSCHIDNDTVRYRVHVLNTQKNVISIQTASISELEFKLFLLLVSATILNLLYITGRTFTQIQCAQVSPFTVYAEFYEICVGTLSYKGVTWTSHKSRCHFGFWITTSGWRH